MEDHSSSTKRLLAAVPLAPNDRIPAGATDEEIDAFQLRLGYAIPAALREWLRTSNGPCVGPGGLFGIGSVPSHLSIEHHLSLHPKWQAQKWLPISGDGCGSYYVLALAHEFSSGFPVVFVEPLVNESSPAFVVASDLWKFLDFILRKELGRSKWPFNRSEVVEQDPAIENVVGVRLPWNA